MLVEKVLGTVRDFAQPGKQIDYVDFEWHEVFKRLHRKVSREGREVAMRFEDHILLNGLQQDDVLAVAQDVVIAVNILPCKVLVIKVNDRHQTAKVCYEIGNKHAALFYGDNDDELITPYDQTIEILMKKIPIETAIAEIRLDFTNSISVGGPHTHVH